MKNKIILNITQDLLFANIVFLLIYRSALDAQQHLRVPGHEHLMVSDDEENSEITFLKTLSKQEKKKLLK